MWMSDFTAPSGSVAVTSISLPRLCACGYTLSKSTATGSSYESVTTYARSPGGMSISFDPILTLIGMWTGGVLLKNSPTVG